MAQKKANCRFRHAMRAWLAGASLVAMTALLPVGAQASTQHKTETHSAHIASAKKAPVHKAVPHKLASSSHKSSKTTGAKSTSTKAASETHHTQKTKVASQHSKSKARNSKRYAAAGHKTRSRVAAEYRHSGLQCVPYAREVSHITLSGNAFLWWAQAAGRYARGNSPEAGSVLNFRSTGRMPLGHVAVVTAVLDPRTILVTQANWVRGTITNDVTVQDVSANNDWSAVKVELGDTSTMGSTYPTYGFIYNRPDTGTVIASNSGARNEVAEAPVSRPVASQAPDRNLQ